jgi:hypothetical protein
MENWLTLDVGDSSEVRQASSLSSFRLDLVSAEAQSATTPVPSRVSYEAPELMRRRVEEPVPSLAEGISRGHFLAV